MSDSGEEIQCKECERVKLTEPLSFCYDHLRDCDKPIPIPDQQKFCTTQGGLCEIHEPNVERDCRGHISTEQLIDFFIDIFCIKYRSARCNKQELFDAFPRLIGIQIINHHFQSWYKIKGGTYFPAAPLFWNIMNKKFITDEVYIYGITLLFLHPRYEESLVYDNHIIDTGELELMQTWQSQCCEYRCDDVDIEEMMLVQDLYNHFIDWVGNPKISIHKFRYFLKVDSRSLTHITDLKTPLLLIQGG